MGSPDGSCVERLKRNATDIAKALARLLVLAALVYFIRRKVSLSLIYDLLHRARSGHLIGAMMCMGAVPVAMALRLGYVSGIGARRLVPCIFKAYFFSNLLPAQVGGDVYKIVFLSRFISKKKRVVGIVMGDRLIGVATLGLISVVNISLGRSYFTDHRVYTAVAIYLILVSVVFGIIFWTPGKWMNAFRRCHRLNALLMRLNEMRSHAKGYVSRGMLLGSLYTVISYALLVCANVLVLRNR